MPKQGEIDLPDALGGDGRNHAYHKPFSDVACGRYLRDIGGVMELLPPSPARLLDVGVGPGWTSLLYAQRGYTVTAQDISPGMIGMARQKQAEQRIVGVEFLVQDYERMTFEAEFDCAVFYDSLHHAEDEHAALRAVYRALKPGGTCITAEPCMGHHDSDDSKTFSARFGVTEKDMHPALIVAAAHRVGFGKFEVFERVLSPPLLASGQTGDQPPAPGRATLARHYFTRALRCLFYGPRRNDARSVGLVPSDTFTMHNFVRLTK